MFSLSLQNVVIVVAGSIVLRNLPTTCQTSATMTWSKINDESSFKPSQNHQNANCKFEMPTSQAITVSKRKYTVSIRYKIHTKSKMLINEVKSSQYEWTLIDLANCCTLQGNKIPLLVKITNVGREPWSSGYGRRLMFQRSWVQILAPNTGWTFFCINLL